LWFEMSAVMAFDTEGRAWWLVVRSEEGASGASGASRRITPVRWELAGTLPFIRPEILPEKE
jgi:hypothetical protein